MTRNRIPLRVEIDPVNPGVYEEYYLEVKKGKEEEDLATVWEWKIYLGDDLGALLGAMDEGYAPTREDAISEGKAFFFKECRCREKPDWSAKNCPDKCDHEKEEKC
jgi:hypothetical protein